MDWFIFRGEHFTPAEFHAIEVHKYFLSEKAGYDVGIDFAVADWLEHYAVKWRQDRLKKELDEQILEIEKHKWIESEKAGFDLGNHAALDWVVKHAAHWREHQEHCRRFK
jgi:hypothetical protein